MATPSTITGTMGGSGLETSLNNVSSYRIPGVADLLERVDLSRLSFTQLMEAIGTGERPKQVKYVWHEASRFPRNYTVNGATTAGSADGAKTITLDSTSGLKKYDILACPENATDTSTLVFINSVDSTTDITVYDIAASTFSTDEYAATAFGTVPAFADNENLYWYGNAKHDGHVYSDSKHINPAAKFNYVQTFDAKVDLSFHKDASANYGPDEFDRYVEDQFFEMMKSREYSFLFNEHAGNFDDPSTGRINWISKGMFGYAGETITLTTSGGVPSQANVIDFVWSMFDDNNGGDTRVLLAGKDFAKAVDKANTGIAEARRTETIAGMRVGVLEGSNGNRILVRHHPGFEEVGKADKGIAFDPAKVSIHNYLDLEGHDLELHKGSGAAASRGFVYSVSSTLRVLNADTVKICTI